MKNNPYVGPRPYERIDQDNFYGRKRESRDLLSLILAERVVLFYAPSGAGKTSLLNAQVIPALEADDFRVLPATRVGSDLPPGINSQDVENIFVFSALMGLAEDQVPVETLTGHTLLSFLHELCPKDDPDDNPPILVLDQFEEILTTHRDRWQDARGFFEQMREALRGMPSLGVVFSMREDYVAGMDPYASLLPRRLRARFRMERLDRRGALEAMKKPAQNAGCPFDPGVAERLVDDLRRIKTVQNSAQQPDDQTTVLGPFIEPVQLQVVCNRLWENLPEQEDNAIQWEEVEEFGNVDRALTDFYENALVQCVEETGVSERQLRSWFGEHLITPMQTRGLALRGEHETNGLPNEAVDVLSNRHLIRADMRAGARWYELSHDRLVDPILASNTAWDIARETPLRMTAKRWQETKDEDLVYRDKTLAEALIWSQNHPDEVEPYELEFLEVSQKVQRGRNRARWLRTLVIILLAIGIVATAWSAYVAQKAENTAIAAQEEAEIKRQEAEQAQAEAETERQAAQASAELAVAKAAEAEAQRLEAERQQQIALAQSLAALAPYTNNDDELTILLAIESLNVTGDSPGPAGWLIDHALRDVLTKPYFNNTLSGHEDDVRSVAFSADGRWLASGSAGELSNSGTVRVWDMNDLSSPPRVLSGHEDWVTSVAFSADGRWLASGSDDCTVRVWDMNDLAAAPRVLSGHEDTVWSVALSADGQWLASGSHDHTVRVWDMNDLSSPPRVLSGHEDWVTSVAFSADGRWLASSSYDRAMRVWDMNDLSSPPRVLSGHESWVSAVAFSPDGRWLASGSYDRTLRVWDMNDLAVAPRVLNGHEAVVFSVAFSPDGRWLASGSGDYTARVWIATLEELAEIGCQRVYRNMTHEEWNRYLPGEPYRVTCPNRPVPED